MNNMFAEQFWMDAWVNDTAGKDTLAVHKGYSTAQYWDNASVTYNTNNDEIKSRRMTRALAALKDKGLLFEGMRVLDIGCGTGMMALALAQKGALVTAMDFSPGMLDRFKANIPKDLNDRITLVQKDWHQLDIRQTGWEKAFDLVVAFMSPAVATPEAFSKMIQCAAKGCAIRGWAARRQPEVFKDLWEMIMNRPLDDKPQSILYKINLLLSMGLYPDVYFDVVDWDQRVSVETEAENQVSFFTKVTGKADKDIRPVIHSYLQRRAGKGQIRKKQKGLTATAVFLVDPLI
ncbi:class I SAM-dependent methyltransferase [Desulfobacter curvatus]|uniref:class I SAM-dependent methyltransferase n=1 Tax=Desulfobacter curvatus TaxID=2290 RepID=UPI00037EE5A4|nr:class I SAM-dependent methyltransferase [Desulfobacter curvatus]